MTQTILLSPPFAFVIIFIAAVILSCIFSRWAFRKEKNPPGAKKAYACGEDFQEHLIQPDYSRFFPFAFFFTILHVVALVIATVPPENTGIFFMAGLYISAAVIGLIILLRK